MQWNAIVGVCSVPNEVDIWLAHPQQPDIQDLGALLEAMEPDYRELMRDTLNSSQEIVTKIKEILPKLREVFQPDKRSSVIGLAGMTLVCGRTPVYICRIDLKLEILLTPKPSRPVDTQGVKKGSSKSFTERCFGRAQSARR